MNRRPILSKSRPQQPLRHDSVLRSFGHLRPETAMAGGGAIEHEVREAEDRLGHVSNEKRSLERKVLELQQLNDRRERCAEQRDRIVRSLERILAELQRAGALEVRRAERLQEAGGAVRRLRISLEALQRQRGGEGAAGWTELSEDGRKLAEIEAGLAAELDLLEALEAETGGGVAWEAVTAKRRGFVEWMRLGLMFFLPVVVIALLAAMLLVGFVGMQ